MPISSDFLPPPPQWQRLGESGILVELANPTEAASLAAWLENHPLAGVLETIPAYHRLGLAIDCETFDTNSLNAALLCWRAEGNVGDTVGTLHRLPCCYDMGEDLGWVAERLSMAAAEVVLHHTHHEYAIMAIGFCPGFPYLGWLPPELEGLPRLPTPRIRVEAGSVGLTGRQTGVYPLVRPGGWPLIGRVPLCLVDVAADYFPLAVGDRIRFESISAGEFESLLGRRL